MSGLYIHIPFCKQRCFYCDFYSTVGAKMASRYVDALVAELKMRCREIDMASIHTLYIGGGTPSFLSRGCNPRIRNKAACDWFLACKHGGAIDGR